MQSSAAPSANATPSGPAPLSSAAAAAAFQRMSPPSEELLNNMQGGPSSGLGNGTGLGSARASGEVPQAAVAAALATQQAVSAAAALLSQSPGGSRHSSSSTLTRTSSSNRCARRTRAPPAAAVLLCPPAVATAHAAASLGPHHFLSHHLTHHTCPPSPLLFAACRAAGSATHSPDRSGSPNTPSQATPVDLPAQRTVDVPAGMSDAAAALAVLTQQQVQAQAQQAAAVLAARLSMDAAAARSSMDAAAAAATTQAMLQAGAAGGLPPRMSLDSLLATRTAAPQQGWAPPAAPAATTAAAALAGGAALPLNEQPFPQGNAPRMSNAGAGVCARASCCCCCPGTNWRLLSQPAGQTCFQIHLLQEPRLFQAADTPTPPHPHALPLPPSPRSCAQAGPGPSALLPGCAADQAARRSHPSPLLSRRHPARAAAEPLCPLVPGPAAGDAAGHGRGAQPPAAGHGRAQRHGPRRRPSDGATPHERRRRLPACLPREPPRGLCPRRPQRVWPRHASWWRPRQHAPPPCPA
jgi:hypothetical protein